MQPPDAVNEVPTDQSDSHTNMPPATPAFSLSIAAARPVRARMTMPPPNHALLVMK